MPKGDGKYRDPDRGKERIRHTASKFTPERRKKIVELIAEGVPKGVAIKCSRISDATFYIWRQRGEKARQALEKGEEVPEIELEFLEFLEETEWADAEAERLALSHVKHAFSSDWKSAMTFLERRHPSRWGRKERVDIAAEEPIKVTLSWE